MTAVEPAEFVAGLNDSVNFACYSHAMANLTLAFAAFAALVLVNAWTIMRFWQDKQRAMAGDRRISEADLLVLALIGGSPGALLARRLFRHKTPRSPSHTQLFVIIALQIGAGPSAL